MAWSTIWQKMSQDASILTKEKQMEEMISSTKEDKLKKKKLSCLSEKDKNTFGYSWEPLNLSFFLEEACEFIDH